jgi:hypothetical protein
MENSTTPAKWYDKTWLVIVLCIIFFPVGLYALWKNGSISKGVKIVVTVIISLIVLTQLGKDKRTGSANNVSSVSSAEPVKEIGIGQVLKTDYFDITVNKVSLVDKVNTGNEFSDLKPESGNNYLIINASFKNIDNESRMLVDGSVWINYNGKDYEFDKSETIMADGFGLLLDQINPLVSKTTNLVYKIPSEIKGNAYWQPGRANDDQRILLGKL